VSSTNPILLTFRKTIENLYRPTGLRFRLTAMVLLISVVVLMTATAFIGTRAATIIERDSNERLQSANRTLSAIVSVWLESPLSGLRNLVSLPDLISMKAGRQKPLLKKMAVAYPYMYLISTTDLTGKNVARNDDEKPIDYSDRTWYQQARQGAPIAYQSLIGKTSHKPALVVSMPIKNQSNRIVGVGMFATVLDKLAEEVQVTRLGKTGFAYLIDRQNRVLAHPDPAYTGSLRDLSAYPPVAALRKGTIGQMSFSDESGLRWRAYVSELENGWGVVIQQQEDELFSTRRLFQYVAAAIIFVAVLVLTCATWWIARRALQPIETLTQAVTSVASNNANYPDFEAVRQASLHIRTRDEVGTLAESFSQMAVRLQATLTSLEQELYEHKQTEAALRESEGKFRTLVNNVNIGVYRNTSGPQGRFVQANPAIAKMFGYDSVEQFMGVSVAGLYHNPEDRKSFVEEIKRDGFVKNKELALRKKDGTPIWCAVTAAAQYDENGDFKFMNGVIEDITERKQTEEALRESEGRYRTLIDNINIGVYRTTPDGRYLQVNPAMAKIFGYDAVEHLMKTPVNNIYQNPDDRKQFFEELRATGTVRDVEMAMKKKNGTPIWTSLSVTAQFDDQGAIQWVDGVLEDITERKRAEEALRKAHDELEKRVLDRTRELSEANNKLQELDRLKSMFLANMSHEIRTPMNGIIGMAELLMDTQLTKEQREYVHAVKFSADSLLTIINDILDFSKIEARKMELEDLNFSLRDNLGDTMQTLAPQASEKGLEIAYDIASDVPDAVVGDPGRLRQIIVNLVGNAVKFTQKGEVVVSVRPETLKGEELHLHFAVADTGIGISPEKRERIFEAFSQADASTTRKYGGTGLGLTISARLVEIMGGRIWVESDVNKGSVFHFTVRLGLQKGPIMRTVPEKRENLQDLSVLVVDDNATNRRILEEMLKSWRMRPTVADSGAAALQMMQIAKQKGLPFQLLLLDANMPNMDGFELAERIKQSSDIAGAAIMMLTSSGQRGDASRCREVGISAYLTKPIKQSSLLDAITTVLGKAEPAIDRTQLVTCHTLREKQRRLRILLTEDNAVNQKLAIAMLTKRGHSVVAVDTGKEAITALEHQGDKLFDLILMDIQMPEMDGFEATAVIRKKEKTVGTHLPIIALTAHAMKGTREMCLDAGMDGYVSKPLRPSELFSAIEALISVPAPSGKKDTAKIARQPNNVTEAVFNKEDALASVDGDKNFLKEIVELFVKECPTMVAQIRQAVNEGNAPAVDRASHKLKGVVGNFGGRNAYDLAWKLERMGKNSDLTNAKEVFTSLEKEMDRLTKALERFVGESQA